MHADKSQKNKKNAYIQGTRISVEKNLIAVFLEHVSSNPNLTAIMTSDTSWSYQALLDDVLVWKDCLKALDVQTPVLLCLHRTPHLVSMLLALQWLEVVYIPVEPNTPLERLRAIIDDSQAAFLIHDTVHHEAYASLPCNVCSLGDLEQEAEKSLDSMKNTSNSNSIAYVIYTSGSTGTPKGVRVSRGALDNFLSSMSHYFLNEEEAILLATTTFTFDIAALELYLPLWQQKTLFLANEAEHKDPLRIEALLKKHPITLLQGTPSFWNMLHYSGWQGKKDLVALTGGEPLTAYMTTYLLPHVLSLWNMYGPTEATIWCSLKKITSDENITVGRPIHNLEMCILDDAMRALPAGVKGELHIGGLGLAEGYMNNPSLTHEKFVSYKQALGGRLYRTGDIACMTEEGEFIIYGRVDNQVKLHGYRIELEDIEAHIQRVHVVRACVVVVHQEQLVAYVCMTDKNVYAEDDLINTLSNELPAFMVPNRFIYLETLPLNTSGKVDRKALPKPHHEEHHESTYVTPMQGLLLNIWGEILGVSSININDNFFELGGHSLLAVRIVVKVRQELKKEVNVSDIYQAPSILEFSELLNTAPDVTDVATTMDKKRISSWIPLTDFQFVLWISNLFDSDVKKLNVVGRRRMTGVLDQTALNLALQAVVQKHDVLSYVINRFFPVQKKQAREAIVWHENFFLDGDEEETETYLNQSMEYLSACQEWSSKKPLLIARLFKLSDEFIELQIAMPHMVADQQSLGIFFHDLSHAYLFYSRNLKDKVNLKTHAFESYVRHEHHVVRSALHADETFWKTYLKDAELFYFPKKYMLSPVEKTKHAYSSFFKLEDKRLLLWREFCVEHGLTLNDLLCAAIGLALQRSCQEEVALPKHLFINTVKSTREDPAYDEVIGCFLRTQPIKLDLTGEKSIVSLAKQVQSSVLKTSPHQYASSLIKLASIGHLKDSKKRIKPLLISLVALLFGKMRKQPYHLSAPILNACKRLAKLDRKRGFVVNVNIWNSFFSEQYKTPSRLFGTNCQAIAARQKDIFTIDEVLDVCLFKDIEQNTSFLVLSANLKPEFREHLGQVLLDVLST